MYLKDFTIEYLKNPVGIDAVNPRFSWKLVSEEKNIMQKTYQIRVCDGKREVWNTGTIESDHSICIRYEGEALKPRTRYQVKVAVKNNLDETAETEGYFETGLLASENWKAKWITHGFEDALKPCAVFVKKFTLGGKVAKARLYASALGIYEFTVNGKAGSDIHFAPGWTSYQKILQYQTYDVTSLLEEENELKFTVGNGWYKGILGFFNQGNHYGNRTALITQLIITYEDGKEECICTDESWISTTEAYRYSEIYHGEVIDYSIGEQEQKPVKEYSYPIDVLRALQDEPVRITQRIPGKKLILTPKGEVVIDFGQNLTGVVEVYLKKPKGTKVTIRHAEALDENGNFYTANLRTAKAQDTFICSGEGDLFHPMFTYHGFRYIAVEGLGNEIHPEDFTACVMHTELEKTGSFTCSNPLVNQLMSNIEWGLRDNFLDIPTDCPQRDERLGYTGDTQIFLSTAACCRNVAKFFEKWLQDLKYEQSLGMGVPTTIPNILGSGGGIAIWHDAAVIVPWTLYENYGDISFLKDQFESMMVCVDYYKTINEQIRDFA